MLTTLGSKQRLCDGLPRRSFLQAGALAVGGLTLADLLRLRARADGGTPSRGKAVIMVYRVLGIDPATTISDHQGRPIYLLDDRRPIAEL